MRRSPLSLRAFLLASSLIPATVFAAGPPPKHLPQEGGNSRPAPVPFRDPDDDKPPAVPLGGAQIPLIPQPTAVPTPAPTPRETGTRVASGDGGTKPPSTAGSKPPLGVVRPPVGRPISDNPSSGGQTVSADNGSDEPTNDPNLPPTALGAAPYNLGDVKKVMVGEQLIDEAPMRVGNLDILVPMVEELPALGATVTRIDPKLIPDGGKGPTEDQYIQLNVAEDAPIIMTVGRSKAYISSNEQALRCAPLVIGQKIYLPVFSLAPLLGAATRLDSDGILHLTPTVQSVELFPVRDSVALTVKTSMPVPAQGYKVGYLHNPERLFIDFPGYSMGFDAGNSAFERPVSPGAGDVVRARAGMPSKFPDVTRITLDLNRPFQGINQELPQKRLFALVLVPQGGTAVTPQVPGKRVVELGSGSLRGMTIVVDAGHGGFDTGARGAASLEKDHTLDIALRLANHLQGRGANVLLTRRDDNFVTLDGRTTFANTHHADLFIAIHINASVNQGSQGTETYYYTGISGPLAKEIHAEFLKATGRPDRGVRTARFYVIRKTWMPSVLLETAFITNPTEEKLLMSEDFRENVAVGITRGILNYAAKYGKGLSG